MRPSLRAGITFLISASSALCEQCTHDAFNGSTWVLDGCEALDLSCPPPDAISRAPACANALLPGEVAALAAALKGSSVTAIQLRGSPLGQSGAAALVPALTKLHTLGLGSCRVGDAGAKIIADVLLPASKLQSLDLAHNSLSDDGVRQLAAALKKGAAEGGLQNLDLSWNGIGPRGELCLSQASPL